MANTGADIAQILKYFSISLLDILREITLQDDAAELLSNEASNSASIENNQASASNTKSGSDNGLKTGLNLANLAESATSLGAIVSKTVYSLNEDKNDMRTYSGKAKKYPQLNFVTLYHSLMNIIEIIPNIQTSQIGRFFYYFYIFIHQHFD